MTAYYNEIDPAAAALLRELIAAGHIAPGTVDERSIEDVRPDELAGYAQCHFFAGVGIWSLALRSAGIPDDYRVWSMSCPCQPFSAAGKGAGFADERHLWPAAYHLISQCRPERIVGEQVASKDTDPWIDLVQVDLEALGYAFGCVPFPSAGVGAPHIRDRAYWCAGSALGDSSSTGLERFSIGHSAPRGWQGEIRPIAEAGESDRLGKPTGNGREMRRDIHGELSGEGFAEGCNAGGLDNTTGDRRCGCRACGQIEEGRQPRPERAGQLPDGLEGHGTDSRPGPVNGHWSAADWLHCRDGKWRPVEPTHVKMVDGNSESMGRMRSRLSGLDSMAKIHEGSLKNEELQMLSNGVNAQAVWSTTRGQRSVSDKGVLRQGLHGEIHGRTDKSSEHQELIPSISEKGAGNMHPVQRIGQEDACTPSGREHDEQCGVKFDDIVRFLPSSLSFAEFSGDRWTSEGLRALRSAVSQDWTLCDTPDTIEAVWASLSEEKKDRVRLGFDAARWEIVAPFPLARSLPRSMGAMPPELRGLAELAGLSGESLKRAKQYRVQQLKGYGNAINAQAATAFVECAFNDKTNPAQ